MPSRREFLTLAAAAGLSLGRERGIARAASRQAIREGDVLRFPAKGQVTLLHIADCHAQLRPLYLREPSIVPKLPSASLDGYMLSSADFVELARSYGRVGGMDRVARLIKAVRAERGEDRVLLLDGGDAMQGSYTALQSYGGDMMRVLDLLGVEATTGHWEFTYGERRVREIEKDIKAIWLAGNVVDEEWQEPAFDAMHIFERGGLRIAVIGQAYPFTPIANPRWLMPNWSFGLREKSIAANAEKARKEGADLVVLLSHNGIELDRKLATRVPGLDVILSAHTHDATLAPENVNRVLLIASGSYTKFVSRLDLDVGGGKIRDYAFKLIPVLSDAIQPDPEMAALIDDIRKPHEAMLAEPLARTDELLYRRARFGGALDDVLCRAIATERDAEIALSPGFRWGPSLLPGQDITAEDLYAETAITYPVCYRREMTGAQIRALLEDVADNVFNPDPYYRQGGDMTRAGGLDYRIDPEGTMGRRISDVQLRRTGRPIEPAKAYVVSGWGSTAENQEGPPIWDLAAAFLKREKTVRPEPQSAVRVVGG